MWFLRSERFLILFICLILVVNIAFFIASRYKPQQLCNKTTEGNPYYFISEPKYWSPITDCAENGEYLYVLFGAKGVIACFDLNGIYSHSYAVNMRKNGESHLYIEGNKLYLESNEHGLYCFVDGIFQSYEKPSLLELTPRIEMLKNSTQAHEKDTGVRYYLQGASVIRECAGKSAVVLRRNYWLTIFQGATQWIIHFICIICIALIKLMSLQYGKR